MNSDLRVEPGALLEGSGTASEGEVGSARACAADAAPRPRGGRSWHLGERAHWPGPGPHVPTGKQGPGAGCGGAGCGGAGSLHSAGWAGTRASTWGDSQASLWPRRRGLSYRAGVSLVAQMVKRLPAMQETQIQGLRTHPNKCWPERHSTKDGPFKHICKKISILKRRKGNRRRAGSFGAQTGLGCQGAPGPPVSQSI